MYDKVAIPKGYITQDDRRGSEEIIRKLNFGSALGCGFKYTLRHPNNAEELYCEYYTDAELAIDRQVAMILHWRESGHFEHSGVPIFSMDVWRSGIITGSW